MFMCWSVVERLRLGVSKIYGEERERERESQGVSEERVWFITDRGMGS